MARSGVPRLGKGRELAIRTALSGPYIADKQLVVFRYLIVKKLFH